MSRSHALIIEDHKDLRETLALALQISGIDVASASNGVEGLAQLKARGMPGIIFLDLRMPEMNGWEFLQVLRHEYASQVPSPTVVIVSAEPADPERAERFGALYVQKPPDLEVLIDLARRHCH